MTSAQIVFGCSWFYGVVRCVAVPYPTPIWGLEGQEGDISSRAASTRLSMSMAYLRLCRLAAAMGGGNRHPVVESLGSQYPPHYP